MADEATIEVEFAGVVPVENAPRKVVKPTFSKILTPQDRARIYICLAASVEIGTSISDALKELAAEYKALGDGRDERDEGILGEIDVILTDENLSVVEKSKKLKGVLISMNVAPEEALLLAKAGGTYGSVFLRAAADIATISEE